MGFMLGDLTVEQMEKRLGIEFPKEIQDFMKENHQDNASNVKPGKWHCFDIPFVIVCGDVEVATKIFDSVKHRSKEVKEQLQFSVTRN